MAATDHDDPLKPVLELAFKAGWQAHEQLKFNFEAALDEFRVEVIKKIPPMPTLGSGQRKVSNG